MPPNKHEALLTSDNSGQLWNICVWDPETGSTLTTYKGSSSAPRTLSMIGADYIISAPPSKPILNVWQVNRAEQLPVRMIAPGRVRAMVASPSGSYLLAATEENINIWQISTGKLLRVLSRHYQPVTSLVFTRDGAAFISAGEDGQVLAWSLAVTVSLRCLPGQESRQVGQPDPRWTWNDHALPVTGVHVGHGGPSSRVFTVSLDQTCKVYCMGSGQLLLSVSFSLPLTSVCCDVMEDSVYVGTKTGDIFTFSLLNPPRDVSVPADKLSKTVLTGHTAQVSCLAVSMDGLSLASGGDDNCVRLWHLKSGQCTRTLDHKGGVSVVEFFTPPPAMLNSDLWAPERKLVSLQKGSNENEPFVCNVLHRERRGGQFEVKEESDDFYNIVGDVGHGEKGEGRKEQEEDGMTVEELKQINNQLYKFALKNVISSKT